MSGNTLKRGELKNNVSANLFTYISKSLFKGKRTCTYKFGLLKALLDNVFSADQNYELQMADLNKTFTKVYWNLINVHNIPQSPISTKSRPSKMEQIISQYAKENCQENIPFDSLTQRYQEEICSKTLNTMKQYVFGAFYGDTDGYLFGFSKADNKVWLNEKSFHFLADNKVLLDQINYYEWLKMCEGILSKAHDRRDNLSTVLENITKRANLDYFKDELNKLGKNETCFYCGKHLSSGAPLDHVIPWDFIKQDELWNFVFACPTCNSSKNNKIPAQTFLKKLIKRNKKLKIESPDIQSIVKTAKMNGIETGWQPKKK
jgi:hypothetical protein